MTDCIYLFSASVPRGTPFHHIFIRPQEEYCGRHDGTLIRCYSSQRCRPPSQTPTNTRRLQSHPIPDPDTESLTRRRRPGEAMGQTGIITLLTLSIKSQGDAAASISSAVSRILLVSTNKTAPISSTSLHSHSHTHSQALGKHRAARFGTARHSSLKSPSSSPASRHVPSRIRSSRPCLSNNNQDACLTRAAQCPTNSVRVQLGSTGRMDWTDLGRVVRLVYRVQDRESAAPGSTLNTNGASALVGCSLATELAGQRTPAKPTRLD